MLGRTLYSCDGKQRLLGICSDHILDVRNGENECGYLVLFIFLTEWDKVPPVKKDKEALYVPSIVCCP